VYTQPIQVTALAFTPDNKKIVAAGNHELTIWDVETGKLSGRLRTRSERTYGLVFLPDGKLAVAGGRSAQEGDVRVYDLTAKPAKVDAGGVAYLDGVHDKSVLVAHLLDCDDTVWALALSKDGKKLAAGGCDRQVRVWDISAGVNKAKLVSTFENHADWVLGLAFSPDGKWLLSASRDKTAKIWDLAAKESVVTFPDHQLPVFGVALSFDGKQGLSVGDDGNLRFWQATDQGKNLGKQTKLGTGGHTKGVFRLVVYPDPAKALAATGGADGTVKLWNLTSGAATKTLTGPTDWVYSVALSPDGSLVAGGSWKGEVFIWKVSDGTVARNFNASPGLVPAEAQAPQK
jgi:WD40 repeat protein